ncbi:MAG: hypothetical protein H6737_07350 [Alphaproteobacteria bacterium]|nr:hypothetical protein [Alphaproteobacteria bacterium]
MIGRDQERDWLARTLSAPGAVCQLVGPPGIGKSTIARAVAGGRPAVWIALEPVPPGSVLSVLAKNLDTPATPGSVAAGLGSVEVAVFDGAEAHEEELQELVDGWKQKGVRTRVVVTTQRRMAIGPVLEVGPLPHDEAVALFLERAREVSANRFAADPEAVGALVKRVDGWPLAVELAASRVRLFSPAELLEEDPLSVLADRNRRGRHASLEAALESSWALLAAEDRLALSRIALVCGWFGKQGFQDVTGSGLGALERLMDASLVRWVAVPKGRRYALLGAVRAFALDRLPADDEARERYARVVLARSDEARRATRGPDAGRAYEELRELQTDLEHLLDGPPLVAARAALALATVAVAHGPVPAALKWVRRVPLDPSLPGDIALELAHFEAELLIHLRRHDEALQRLEGLADTVHTVLLRAWAVRDSDLAASTALYERARVLADADGDRFDRAVTRLSLGVVLRRSERHAEAAASYREGLQLARASRAGRIEAVFLANLALMDSDLHGYDLELRKQIQRAAALIRETGIQRVESQILALLAQCDVDLAHPDVERSLADVVRLSKHVGDAWTLQTMVLLQAVMQLERGETAGLDGLLDEVGVPLGPRNDALLNIVHAMARFQAGDLDSTIERLRAARSRFAEAMLPNEVLMVDIELAAATGAPPPEVDPTRWPADAPMRVAHEIARESAAGAVIPQALVDATARSVDARFVLALARGAVRVEVGADGTWFRTAEGERVDLGRKRVLRRVLEAFASRPGEWITLEELLAEGWPGEKPTGDSGRARVHVAVSELRKLGLRDALVTSPEHVASYCLRAVVRE